ncbi:hypothetical protein [Streptomyces sp. NPDC008001]|uniref:hypothetical protein n=1 Tax=Streptomyces sp. NPDC008001 TaxID=3364804 RepID=UPI0036ED477F
MSGERLLARAHAIRVVAALAVRDYLVAGGLWALPWAVLGRSLVEIVFLWTFSRYVAPDYDPRLAFAGALGFAAVEPTISRMVEVIQPDRQQGVLHRLHLGRIPVYGIMVARAWVYGLEGLVSAVVAGCIAGAAMGYLSVVVSVLPFLVVLTLSAGGFGLGLASFSLGRTSSPMVGYFAVSVVLLAGGAVPSGAIGGAVTAVGNALTLRHGLAAARSALVGGPYLTQLFLELLVGAAWLAAGALICAAETRRARVGGFEGFE